MNGTSRSFNEVRPDSEESQQFWRDIWGKEISHNENAEWLKTRLLPNGRPLAWGALFASSGDQISEQVGPTGALLD